MGVSKQRANRAVQPVKKVGAVRKRLPPLQQAEELRVRADRIERREKISQAKRSSEAVRACLAVARGLRRLEGLEFIPAPVLEAALGLGLSLNLAIEAEAIRLDKERGQGLIPGVG